MDFYSCYWKKKVIYYSDDLGNHYDTHYSYYVNDFLIAKISEYFDSYYVKIRSRDEIPLESISEDNRDGFYLWDTERFEIIKAKEENGNDLEMVMLHAIIKAKEIGWNEVRITFEILDSLWD